MAVSVMFPFLEKKQISELHLLHVVLGHLLWSGGKVVEVQVLD